MKRFLNCLLITIVLSIAYLVNTPKVFAQPVIDDQIGTDTYSSVNPGGWDLNQLRCSNSTLWGAFRLIPGCPASTSDKCNPKGDIDPDTWTSLGEVCNQVKQGEITEKWQCEKTIKYANSRPDKKCTLGSGIECDCIDSGNRSYNTCNSGCSEFGTVGIQCTKQEQCRTRVRPSLIGPDRITNELGTIDINYFNTGINRVCGEISDSAKKEVCIKDASSCFNAIKDATSVDERRKASLNFSDCVLEVKDKALTKVVKTVQEQLKEKYGAWVGAYCNSVWSIHKGKDTRFDEANGSKCENSVKTIRFNGVTGCQNLPPDDDPAHPKLVSCIQTAADKVFKPRTPGTGTRAPAITTPLSQTTARRQEILNNWCAAYLGANTDKGNQCVEEAGTKCGDPNLTNEVTFTNCVKAKGLEMQKGTEDTRVLEPPSRGTPAQPAPQRPPVIAPVITVQALINGLQKVDLFTGVGKVNFSAKITVNNNSSCVKMQTSFELREAQKNELITLPISNTTSCEGYSIDLDALKLAPGEYELTVKPNNQPQAKATFTIKSVSPTPTTPSVLACDVEVYETHSNFIKARIRILSDEGSTINYNRANWFVKEIPPNQNKDFEVTEMVPKGTNIQNKVVKRDDKLYLETTETVLGELKSKTGYRIKAQIYSEQTGSVTAAGLREHATCQGHSILTSDDKITFKKSIINSVVLGDSNIPLESTSFDIVPSVSPDTIVAINVRIVTLDLNGREQETLFNDIWENNRPLAIIVNNPSQISAVKVTVSVVDETNQFSSSEHTNYIPISSSKDQIDQTRQDVPQSFHLLTSPDLAVLDQSIRNGQSSITFIASSEYPISEASFSVNGEKLAPDSILCADKKLGPCGFHLTLYAPFVGKYSVSFEDQTLQFSAPEAVSEVSQKEQTTEQGGGGSANQLIKITISKEDGSDTQVIYENGQFNPAEFANLVEGDNRLIVTKNYSDGQTKTDYLVVVRKSQTEKQKPHEEQPAQQIPEEQVLPQPQEPASQGESAFSHRICGDVSGNVIVDVYVDGSEQAGTNCEDLGQVCKLFDNEGRQDATCVDKESS